MLPNNTEIVKSIVHVMKRVSPYESTDMGLLWGPDMMAFLLNDCLAMTATTTQTYLALGALGFMVLRAVDLPHAPIALWIREIAPALARVL
ncbi:hypothetical protein BC828DRAFT_407036 [Blastocladiella britannica]|nr:hypothetical protein BC828DRAFT_407036 [Blastocladiella britannica]